MCMCALILSLKSHVTRTSLLFFAHTCPDRYVYMTLVYEGCILHTKVAYITFCIHYIKLASLKNMYAGQTCTVPNLLPAIDFQFLNFAGC